MTVVCAIVHDNTMTIGADRSATQLGTVMRLAKPKIWTNGAYLLGYAGTMEGEHLQARFTPPPVVGDTDKFMRTTFLLALDKFYDKWKISRETDEEHGLQLCIMVNGNIYEHEPGDMSMTRYDTNYFAMGSGGDMALGALHATRNISNPKTRIRRALEAACEHSTTCTPPIDILSLNF